MELTRSFRVQRSPFRPTIASEIENSVFFFLFFLFFPFFSFFSFFCVLERKVYAAISDTGLYLAAVTRTAKSR